MDTTHICVAESPERACVDAGMFIQRRLQDDEGWEVDTHSGLRHVNWWKIWERPRWELTLTKFYPVDWEKVNGR